MSNFLIARAFSGERGLWCGEGVALQLADALAAPASPSLARTHSRGCSRSLGTGTAAPAWAAGLTAARRDWQLVCSVATSEAQPWRCTSRDGGNGSGRLSARRRAPRPSPAPLAQCFGTRFRQRDASSSEAAAVRVCYRTVQNCSQIARSTWFEAAGPSPTLHSSLFSCNTAHSL